MLFQALVSGIGFGIVLSLMPGPVFFGLIQTGINKGFRYGVLFALGVALSDVAFIGFTYYGISGLITNEIFRTVLGVGGGILMCLFGIFYMVKKVDPTVPYAPVQKERGLVNFILKGFFLNIFNPFVLIFWLGVVTFISNEFHEREPLVLSFFSIAVVTVFLMDTFKSYLANKIKSMITNKWLLIINRVLGLLLIAVGARLLFLTILGKLEL